MRNNYCMFKGKLLFGAPYSDAYGGSPHYVITVGKDDGTSFNIVVNSASTAPTANGDNRVYVSIDSNFVDPICDKLRALAAGLYTSGFPELDYWQDRSLLDIRSMRPVPYEDPTGARFDINHEVNDLLTIDENTASEQRPYNNGQVTRDRTFWRPSGPGEVTVYGFGFLFPTQDGLHETHMNQGNPVGGGHERENGIHQDGAVIVQKADGFAAIFTAFQTQWLPTDFRGFPVPNAKPLPQFIGE
jgi:uncharacterized protein YukJ